MMKKFWGVFIFITLSLFSYVYAEETKCTTEYLSKTDGSQKVVLSVSGNAGDEIILKLYHLNVEPENKITSENIDTSVIYVNQGTADEEGKFRFSYSFPTDFQEGIYSCVIHNVNTGERLDDSVEYYSQETLNGILSSVYNSEFNAEETFENLYKYRKPLGINSLLLEKMYDENVIPKNALDIFKGNEYKITDSKIYSEAFNNALYMDAINCMNKAENLLKLIEKSGDMSVAEKLGLLDQTEDLKKERYEKFFTLSSEKKSYFIENLKNKRPFATNEEFLEAFNECVFLCRLNLAKNASEIELLINESVDLLENGSVFASKYENERAKIARILYDYKNAESSKEFSDDIKKAISTLYNESTESSSRDVSPGGGGIGVRIINPVETEAKTIEEVKESAETKDKVKLIFKDMNLAPWATEAVSVLSELGVINGKAEEIFAPNDNVLREELVKMAICLFDVYDKNAVSSFTDVNNSEDWFAAYVASAENIGAVKGISETEFGSGYNITREQSITILYRFAVKCGLTFSENAEYIPFDDDDKISEYAKEAIRAFAGSNIVSGYENLIMPDSYCSRAEVAKILYNIYLLSLKTSK